MKVAMIDPSGWTYYYDCVLTKEISRLCDIELLTEKFEYDRESFSNLSDIKYLFLRFSSLCEERGLIKSKRALLIVKGIEYLKDLISVYYYIKKKKFDLVHIQWCPAPFLDIIFIKLLRRNLKIPVIFTAHNILPHTVKSYHKYAFSKVYDVVDGIIVHSESIASELSDLFSINYSKIFVVEHPIFDNYCISNLSKSGVRNSLNIPLEEKVGLFFGRIEEYKGLDILLEAAALVKERGIDFKLIIAGKSENFSMYEKLIDNYLIKENIIKFIHFSPPDLVEKVFCAADVLVLPYKKTYGSGVLLTGIAFNKPAIVTDTGHLPEVIIDGKHGFVVPVNNSEKLSEAIYAFFNLSSENRQKMEKNVKELKNRFLPSLIAQKTLEVYKNICSVARF